MSSSKKRKLPPSSSSSSSSSSAINNNNNNNNNTSKTSEEVGDILWGKTAKEAIDFEKTIIEQAVEAKKRKKRAKGVNTGKTRQKYGGKLPKGLDDIMGEANTHFMKNEYKEALAKLTEVVRQCPGAPDPFHTMGIIHEQLNNFEKAMNAFYTAATLTDKDASLWIHCGRLCFERNEIEKAAACFKKACQLDKLDVHSAIDRYTCEMKLKHYRRATKALLPSYKRLKSRDLSVALRVAVGCQKDKRTNECV